MDPNSNTQEPHIEMSHNEPIMPENLNQKPKEKKIVIILGILILLLVVIILIISFIFNKDSVKQPIEEPTTTIVLTPTIKVNPSTNVTFKETVDLVMNVTKDVKSAGIKLTYISSSNPPENCADCISSTTIDAEHGKSKESLNFSCGGFTGECIYKLDSFGYKIELVNKVDPQTIRVLITK